MKDYIKEATRDRQADRIEGFKGRVVEKNISDKVINRSDKIGSKGVTGAVANKYIDKAEHYRNDRGDKLLQVNDYDEDLGNEAGQKHFNATLMTPTRFVYGAYRGGQRANKSFKTAMKEGKLEKNFNKKGNLKLTRKQRLSVIGDARKSGFKSLGKGVRDAVRNHRSENDDITAHAMQGTKKGISVTKNTYRTAKVLTKTSVKVTKGGMKVVNGSIRFIKNPAQSVSRLASSVINFIGKFSAKSMVGGIMGAIGAIVPIILSVLAILAVVTAMSAITSIFSFSWVADPADMTDIHLLVSDHVVDLQAKVIVNEEEFLEQNDDGNTTYHVKTSVYQDGVLVGDNGKYIKMPDTSEIISYLSLVDESFLFMTVKGKVQKWVDEMYEYESEEIKEEYEVPKYNEEQLSAKCTGWQEQGFTSESDCKGSYGSHKEKRYNVTLIQTARYKTWDKFVTDKKDTMFEDDSAFKQYGELKAYGSIMQAFVVPPVDGWRESISSPFGYRMNPFKDSEEVITYHSGLDFAKPEGTPIYAGISGTVEVYPFDENGLGNGVAVKNSRYTIKYGHCYTIDVTDGQEVTKGDVIATVGNTGLSTGPHLHLMVIDSKTNKQLNPMFHIIKD